MIKIAIVCAAVLLLAAVPSMAQMGVSLDSVEELIYGHIPVGSTGVTFNLRLTNLMPSSITILSNGFRVYGDDSSVTWEILDYGPTPEIIVHLPQYILIAPPEFHGVGADTIGFTASSPVSPGVPPGFIGEFFWITVALPDTTSVGGTFCLDSAWFPPNGIWMWTYGGIGSFAPSWDGPHCWPITAQCCFGQRGNVDGDPEDKIDISDLVFLVNYIFINGPEPSCREEADINGSGGDVIDISDLIHLVDYMFQSGPPPADCP